MLCPPAWDLEKGSEQVVIALIDSGVKYTHPDLADKLWTNPDEIPDNGIDDDNNGYIDDIIGWDFVDTDEPVVDGEDGKIEDNDPSDYHGHGTKCAGIIGASSNNNEGIAGIAWNSKIMILKAGYTHKEKGGVLEHADIVEAIMYATDNGADIISMSFGGKNFSIIFKDACQYAWDNGVLLVGGVGNENIDQIIYPAKYDSVIAVGAIDYFNERCDYDRWGSHWGPEMELVAPGYDITTIVTIFNKDFYSGIDGTSASTACVAGVAALVKSKYYEKDNYWIREKLQNTAIDLGPNGRDEKYGYGKVNAFEAVGGIIPSSNEPPIPNKPNGPTTVKTKEYNYRFEIIDPNGDEVYYMIDFGEGKYPNEDRWYGLIDSGEVLKVEQVWRELGEYEIRVRAMDKFGAMSEWSDPLIVNVNKESSVQRKSFDFNFINNLFYNFFKNVLSVVN